MVIQNRLSNHCQLQFLGKVGVGKRFDISVISIKCVLVSINPVLVRLKCVLVRNKYVLDYW